MLPLFLIVFGGILLITGIAMLLKTPKAESLNQVITAVKADGILTPKEES